MIKNVRSAKLMGCRFELGIIHENPLFANQMLDAGIADVVAEAMKAWALENGATHYTHVFYPLTGATAEKHDAFLKPDGKGSAMPSFAGKGTSADTIAVYATRELISGCF